MALAAAVLALAAATLAWRAAPGLLDRGRFRDAVTGLAAAAIGRPVRIDGALSLALLPEPTLTAGQVVVPDAGDGVTLSVRSLRLGVALGPLLGGRVVPRTVVLQGAALRLPWPLPAGLLGGAAPAGGAGASDGEGPGRLRGVGGSWLAGLQAVVQDGRLSVGGLQAGAIDATLAAAADGLAAAGSLRVGGLAWHASGRLGAADRDGAASLALSVDGAGAAQDTGLRFDARVAAGGTVDGQVAGSGPDLGRLLGGTSPPGGAGLTSRVGPGSEAPPLAWRVAGPLVLAGGQASAADLALTLGGAPAHAAAMLRLGAAPRLDLSFDARRLDLDAWAALLPRVGLLPPASAPGSSSPGSSFLGSSSPGSASPGSASPGSASPGSRPSGVVAAGLPPLALARPALPVALDLLAETATLDGGTLRQLHASLDLGPDGLVLRQGSVVLPGEVLLQLAGQVGHGPAGAARPRPAWRFEGTATLAGPDLRPARRWLLPLLPVLGRVPEGAAGAVALRAGVAIAPGALALSGLDGTLDGVRLGGSLALRLPSAPGAVGTGADAPPAAVAGAAGTLRGASAGARGAGPAPDPDGTPAAIQGAELGIAADLQARGLDLQALLPPPPDGLRGAGAALAGLEGALSGLRGQVRLQAPDARWGGVRLEALALDAALGPGVVLRRLAIEGAGARLAASGTLGPDGGLDAQASLEAADASALAALLPVLPPGMAAGAWRGRLAVALAASGPPDALALRLHAELADATLEATPVLDLAAGAWAGGVTLRHPGARRLLGLLLSGDGPAWLGEGSLAVLAQARAAPGLLALDGLDLTAGGLRGTGQLRLDAGPAGRRLSGELRADTLPLPWPDLTDGAPLPLDAAALAGWQGALQLRAERVLTGGRVVLRRAAAGLALDGATLRLERFTAALGPRAPDGPAAGGLAPGGPARGGVAPGGTAPGGARPAGTPAGTVAADASLVLGGARPPALSVTASLRGLGLGGASALPLRGRVDAQASLTAAGYSPAALLATLAGPVTASATDGALAGFDLAAAARALAAADPSGSAGAPEGGAPAGAAPAPGPQESAVQGIGAQGGLHGGLPGALPQGPGLLGPGLLRLARLRAAVAAALAGGETPFDRLTLAGDVADGALLLRSGALQGAAGAGSLGGSVDLASGRIDLRVALRPSGAGLPMLGLRLQGPLASPRATPELAGLAGWLGRAADPPARSQPPVEGPR